MDAGNETTQLIELIDELQAIDSILQDALTRQDLDALNEAVERRGQLLPAIDSARDAVKRRAEAGQLPTADLARSRTAQARLQRVAESGAGLLATALRLQDEKQEALHAVRAGKKLNHHQSMYGSPRNGGWCDVSR